MSWSRRSVLTGSSAAIIAGAAPRSAWGKTEADVVIIGAGLAGLYAAHRLEVGGLKCVIVEGERRVGGRLHTLDDLPGRPDAGGIQVGSGYKLLRAIADDLKVSLTAGGNEPREALYRINGQSVSQADWKDSPVNLTAGKERDVPPAGLASLYAREMDSFENVADWLSPKAQIYDTSYGYWLIHKGMSAEAERLIRANFNGNGLTTMSLVHMMRSAAIFRSGPGAVSTIEGGSQRLPEAMAELLQSPIRLGEIVTGIREKAHGVAVKTSRSTIHARHAICTIPFAALRHIPIDAKLDPSIAALIADLPYTRASFAYLSASEPFWKSDGLPETLWTDDPWLGRVFVLGDNPPMLKVWTVGEGSALLDNAAHDVATREIISRIEAARPSAKGKLKLERLFSWQKNPMARGIYHHIGLGQAADLARATQVSSGRLHFAGEHLAQDSSGMEGALESGNRVARAIIAKG